MTQTLQVSFRRLVPSEQLVVLARDRYRRLELVHASEFFVSLESHVVPRVTVAEVRLQREGAPQTSAEAAHADPYQALEAALTALEAQLLN
jgi:ribosome-associated translation inhibitor RaiA